jgi:glycosyltransferase involved in cell wall biosynthesis
MKILYVYADGEVEWNSSEIRCSVPHAAILKHPDHESKMMSMMDWGSGSEKAMEFGGWCDVMVIQRLWVSSSLIGIEFWKAKDKVVIGDIDDAFEFLPTNIVSYPYWRKGLVRVPDKEGKPSEMQMTYTPLEQIRWGARLLNGITTPSHYLTQDWKKYNANTHYLANYLDTARYTSIERSINPEGSIILGWGGSHSHKDSWARSGIIPALKRILKKYDNVKLMIAGDTSHAASFKKQFGSKVITINWTPAIEWPKTLGLFDIGLVPLYGKYDLRRSPLKAIEYCLMGIPFVGSDLDIYDEFTPFAHKVKNQPNAWERGLVEMIENYHDVRKAPMWEEAKEIARGWDINRNVDNIVSTYEMIGNQDTMEERYTGDET